MTLAGPQIGGVSFIAHVAVIGAFGIKDVFRKIYAKLFKVNQKISRPFRSDAKL